MRFGLYLACIATYWVYPASAAVTLVQDHRLALPRDRRVVFAMVVTPGQDVLSLIANPEGKWRLSRVRGWFAKDFHEDRITVPGLVLGERQDWFSPWEAYVYLTPDSRYAICETKAFRSGHRGQEEIVSVVDLTAFRIVATLHGPEVPELRGDFRSFGLDRSGHLIAEAQTPFPRHPGDDAFKGGARVKLAVLSIPDLRVIHSCEYSQWVTSGRVERMEGENTCAELLAHEEGADTLTGFKTTWSRGGEKAGDRPRPPGCAFLGYSVHLSPDGKYEREVCISSHRGFWGNPVVTKVMENIYLGTTGEKLGTVNEPRTSVDSRFASVNGTPYLLVMEGGTRLMVYTVTE